MNPEENWKKAGGFEAPAVGERPDALQIDKRRFSLFLKAFALFAALLFAEYLLCGVFFRLTRQRDVFRLDWACAIASPLLCYWVSRKWIKEALKEGVPLLIVAAALLFFSFFAGCFFRFNLQLANGLLDSSEPETRMIFITDKKISIFGGSIQEGLNPEAHLIYFRDWEDRDERCELLTPADIYYFTDIGAPLQVTLRQGFFHMPWVQSFQKLQP